MAFRDVFKSRHVILPVIHVENQQRTADNVEVARGEGADGVFLIGHSMNCFDLLLIHERTRDRFPDFWIGVNCLDLSPTSVFSQVTNKVSGVWVDNAEIMEQQDDQPGAKEIAAARARTNYRGLYFGGVAFKYQRHVTDLARGALLAKDYVDVVTTSGIGTGSAPDVEKINIMKDAIGDHPLAIASGITPDGVRDYLRADVFMVATGIGKNFHDIDTSLLAKLVKNVRDCG
jgi:hypothetical protein